MPVNFVLPRRVKRQRKKTGQRENFQLPAAFLFPRGKLPSRAYLHGSLECYIPQYSPGSRGSPPSWTLASSSFLKLERENHPGSLLNMKILMELSRDSAFPNRHEPQFAQRQQRTWLMSSVCAAWTAVVWSLLRVGTQLLSLPCADAHWTVSAGPCSPL